MAVLADLVLVKADPADILAAVSVLVAAIPAAEDPAADLAVEDHKSHYKYNCCLGRD